VVHEEDAGADGDVVRGHVEPLPCLVRQPLADPLNEDMTVDVGQGRQMSLRVELARMLAARRCSEVALWSTYESARSRLLGAPLDLTAGVLALLPVVEARDVTGPCAEFARILAAIDAQGVATA
jgi:hypothetical protein